MIDNINDDWTKAGNGYQEEHFPPYKYHMINYHINEYSHDHYGNDYSPDYHDYHEDKHPLPPEGVESMRWRSLK